MNYETIAVRFDGPLCFIRFARPEAGNTITGRFIAELHQVLDACDASASVVILEGDDKAFCLGADFAELSRRAADGNAEDAGDPEVLYALWERLATGSYITVSHVKGRANAGGVGFVAASDIVVADAAAEFSLSELVFGLLPACVMPFLINRVGFQKANYLALSTLPIGAQEAKEWGLVDVLSTGSELALRKQLSRLRRLSKEAIARQKTYSASIHKGIAESKAGAVAANRAVFADRKILEAIRVYVETGRFPWEAG